MAQRDGLLSCQVCTERTCRSLSLSLLRASHPPHHHSLHTHSYETDDKGVRKPDLATVIPLVDGGTEGFSGHVRTIFPCVSGCFECTLDLFPPQQAVPLCTIAETPRNAAHCILYAHLIEYPKVRAASTAKQPRSRAAKRAAAQQPLTPSACPPVHPKAFPDDKPDKDDPEYQGWVYTHALARAKQFNIPGVTLMHTQGVIKNIIPAIASTNAIVAAACANEAFKIVTNCAAFLDNNLMYMGGQVKRTAARSLSSHLLALFFHHHLTFFTPHHPPSTLSPSPHSTLLSQGLYAPTFKYERNPQCVVCGEGIVLEAKPSTSLTQLLEMMAEDPRLRLKAPSVSTDNGKNGSNTLYMRGPLESHYKANLDLPIASLIDDGATLHITDPGVPTAVHVIVQFAAETPDVVVN